MVVREPGATRHDESVTRVPRLEHTFPKEQGENEVSVVDVVGFMMYRPAAEQVLDERGQHALDKLHPEAQSWIAPNLFESTPNNH